MKYPTLTELNTSRELVDVFQGYNHNLRIGDGEFFDMTNLSSDNYPILSPRKQRGVIVGGLGAQGITGMVVAKEDLCYIDGDDFVAYNGGSFERFPINGGLSNQPKTLISMGAYVIIMPDKKYINTENPSDNGNIEDEVTTSGKVTFSLCKLDGSEYENIKAQGIPPTSPQNMDLWIDISSKPHQLKQYSSTSKKWTAIATTYIKITTPGNSFNQHFSVDDAVVISGVEGEALSALNASNIIRAKGPNYIVVTGMLDKVTSQESAITISRKMPTMDYIIESNNRLWGCRYGTALNGEMVNEIYASKLGDFKNWNSFQGISTDSYVATVGTDGHFTGAISHLGYPLFFKENHLHKIYGNYPANYQVQTTACRGVQSGCERSLAIVNEVLYYKARSGVCSFDGSLPREVSSALGDQAFYQATAGVLGNKYYISMRQYSSKWHLFVYDTSKGMWHREDDTRAESFVNFSGDLAYLDYGDIHGQKSIKTVGGQRGIKDITPVKWQAVTGVIGTNSPDKKYVSRMDVRMSLSMGAKVSFYVEYDSSGEWEHLYTMDGIQLRTFAVPLRPRRCDHIRLKITGMGDAKIYSICKTIEGGSDV